MFHGHHANTQTQHTSNVQYPGVAYFDSSDLGPDIALGWRGVFIQEGRPIVDESVSQCKHNRHAHMSIKHSSKTWVVD